MKNNKKGFTLIELIVVLAILAVIAAIAVPTAFGAITEAQIAADTASVESFNSAIRMQGTVLRGSITGGTAGSGTGVNSANNDCQKALTAAGINLTGNPQSNGNIGLKWVAPTTTTIGHFEIVAGGKNVVSTQSWGALLKTLAPDSTVIVK